MLNLLKAAWLWYDKKKPVNILFIIKQTAINILWHIEKKKSIWVAAHNNSAYDIKPNMPLIYYEYYNYMVFQPKQFKANTPS